MPNPVGHVEWLAEEASAGCTERSFMLRRPVPVPGVLWTPPATVPQATVLLFHGGSGHKRSERHLQMGRWLASTSGLAVIAIDGPYHGDRVPAPMAPSAYQQLIADEGIESVTARMTADWLEAVAALADRGLADDAHVSVFGMSMGARFGFPAAAALGPRLQCAVLGNSAFARPRRSTPGSGHPASWRRLHMPSPHPCSITCNGTTRSSPGTASSSYSMRWPRQTSG